MVRKEDYKGHQLVDNELVRGGTMQKEATVKVKQCLFSKSSNLADYVSE